MQEESSSSSDFEPLPQTLSFTFHSKSEQKKPLKVATLFIGASTLGSLYLYPPAQQFQLIGDINFDKKKQKPLANVFYKDGICIIRFYDTIPTYVDFDLMEFLFSKLIQQELIKEIVLLCDLTTDDSLDKEIYGLYTAQASSNKCCTLLPRKFSLESLEAQCMIYCQLNLIDAKCFVVRKSSYELDPKDIKKFEYLNQHWQILGTHLDEKQYSEIIKQEGKKFKMVSQMLYI